MLKKVVFTLFIRHLPSNIGAKYVQKYIFTFVTTILLSFPITYSDFCRLFIPSTCRML